MNREFERIVDVWGSLFGLSQSRRQGRATKPNANLHKLGSKNGRRKSLRSAFTLIEAVAAIGLVGIGVASVMGGLSAMANTDRQLMLREEMQRLAVQKFDEIIATGVIETAQLSGDFAEQNIDDYEWSADVQPSGEENLEVITVIVNQVGDPDGPAATVDGLYFQAPIQGGDL